MTVGNAIEVSQVSKQFKVFFDKGTSLKEKLLFQNRRRYEERSVLQGISFSVRKGEAVGIIGENGCGKSTLLKLLSRIMYPDAGSVCIDGRVSALIELGAGFHPDMSGRENIYTNAAIFGLTKREIDRRIQAIIDFSELGDHIDNPVRTYSSGMYMRLAFSVAINVDADVLLVDEILAVGDAAFQAKCFNRMREIKAQGTTIVIVSHSLSQIEQICDRSIWICDGKIRAEGAPRDVHPQYMEYMGRKSAAQETPSCSEKDDLAPTQDGVASASEDGGAVGSSLSGVVEITSVQLLNGEGRPATVFACGEPIDLVVHYRADTSRVEHTLMGLIIFRNDGLTAFGTNTLISHYQDLELKESGTLVCHFKSMDLIQGDYWFDVAIRKTDMLPYVYLKKAVSFSVYSSRTEIGVASLRHFWTF